QARGIEYHDIPALDVLERLDDDALLLADVHSVRDAIEPVLGDVAGHRGGDHAVDRIAARQARADLAAGDGHRLHFDDQRLFSRPLAETRPPEHGDLRQPLYFVGPVPGAEPVVLVGADEQHQRRLAAELETQLEQRVHGVARRAGRDLARV